MASIKSFRWPWLWVGLWWLSVLAVVAVCLVPPPPLPPLPENSDKVEHFLAYFLLAAAAVQIYATRAAWSWAGIGLVAMGIGIEFAQGALTATRMADPWDALANTLGVLAGMATALTPWRDSLLRMERGSRG